MKRQVSAAGIICLLVVGGLIGLINFESDTVQASTGLVWYVGGSGGGNYSTIQSAIDDANPGDTVFVYDDNSPYLENIIINKTLSLIGENKDTTIIDGGNNGDTIQLNSNYTNITDFTFKNNGFNSIMLKLTNGQHNNILNNNFETISTYYGYGMYLTESSDNNHIKNNNFNFIWGRAIQITSSSNNNIIIRNNVTGSEYPIHMESSSFNEITANNISGNKYGINIVFSTTNKIKNNNITSNKFWGINLNYSSANNIVSDNNISSINYMNWWSRGIHFSYTKTNQVYNNSILKCGTGYYISYSSGNNISGSNILLSEWDGIYLAYSSNNNITNNNISESGNNGIELSPSSKRNTIAYNNISINNVDGIFIDRWSDENNILNNNIENNQEKGIYIYRYSEKNHIFSNNISSNAGHGIYISASGNNKIFKNNLINNGIQALDDSGVNFWNNTYPSSGNYWSDYTGVDQKSGPNQSLPGSDGIGDTPYTNISGGAGTQDNYPLMYPVNWTPVNKGTLSGYVRDVFSNPISGARVKVSYHGTFQEDYSDSNGYYYVSNIPICYCIKNVSVTKSGYFPIIIDTSIIENWVHNFTLHLIQNVSNIDTNEYFETIQEAIDDMDTMDGHYIIVTNGTYYENLVIDKSIKLFSSTYYAYMLIDGSTDLFSTDSHTHIIDGNQKDNVIYIKANHVTISGFTICNGTNGILIDAWGQNITIRGNNIINNDKGVYLIENSDNNRINSNNLSYNTHGIFVALDSHNNIMNKNMLFHNIRNGIVVIESNNQTIEHNTISWSGEEGIYFQESSNNNIKNNFISNNLYGLYFHKSSNNTIYHNNIIDNTYQAYEIFSNDNQWNNSYSIGGNYWSDYSGEDYFSGPDQNQFGSDGIGDSPYTAINSTGTAIDSYPFMTPNGWLLTEPGILYGYVYDSDWNPLPDALVMVEFHDEYREDHTDSEGFYRITDIPICNCTKNVSVTKNGYEPKLIHISIDENTFQQFILKRLMSVLNVDTGKYFNSIQGAIDDPTTYSGHTITVGNGIYFENLWMNKSVTLIGEDKNNTIIDGRGDRVIYSRGNSLSITGFTIRNGADGIYVYETLGNNISGNKILSNRENGINLYASSNGLFYNNEFSSNGYAGIAQFYSTNNEIIGNDFQNEGIYIGGKQLENYNSHTIINNYVNGKPLYYYKNTDTFFLELLPVGQVILANCSNVMLKNLELINTTVGIELAYCSEITIIYNNISNNLYGLYSYSSSSIYMDANKIANNHFYGLELELSSNCTILKNSISGNYLTSFNLLHCSYNSITENNISSNDFSGLYLAFSSYNTISDNDLQNNFECIGLDSSNNNIINNNYISDNYDGFLLSYSTNNIIQNNEIVSNYYRGIQVASTSDNNIIISNNITDNDIGILVALSTSNRIYHNNFFNNTQQILDEYNYNIWNDSYPSGGNYWSDYNGTDANSDGIGDTPYVINEFNQDYYPLIEPWAGREPPEINITITLSLDKHEFYVGEVISGSIEINNNNPFAVTFNDQGSQRLEGVFFDIISQDNNDEFDVTYDYYPIQVEAWSTLTIEFEIEEIFTLLNGTKQLNYTTLPIGNYIIYSFFYYGQWFNIETYHTNTEAFNVIQSPGYLNGNGESDEFYRSIIFTSTVTLIIIFIIISLAVFGTEVGKYKFFTAFVAPLYSRTLKKRKKNYQDGYIRGSVRGYILGNPGETYNTIKRVLELPNGTLAYHLKFLEREGEVKSERDGLYKRFYPIEGRITKEVFDFTKIQQKIFELIGNVPGLSQKEISKRLKEPAQKINYHIRMMVDARVLKLERDGNKTKCYILEEVS